MSLTPTRRSFLAGLGALLAAPAALLRRDEPIKPKLQTYARSITVEGDVDAIVAEVDGMLLLPGNVEIDYGSGVPAESLGLSGFVSAADADGYLRSYRFELS